MGKAMHLPQNDRISGTGADQRLYRLEPPLDGHEYVIVSALPFETYIFPADAGGNATDWGALKGSFKGSPNHEEALLGAGYSVN